MLQLCDIWNDRINGHLRNAMENRTPHNSHALFA
jgi:hypothetical protein